MRAKPEHVRKQYAFGVSFGITALIFVFWLASFGIMKGPIADNTIKPKAPLASLTASAGDAASGFIKYVKELVFGVNQTQYSADKVEVRAGKI